MQELADRIFRLRIQQDEAIDQFALMHQAYAVLQFRHRFPGRQGNHVFLFVADDADFLDHLQEERILRRIPHRSHRQNHTDCLRGLIGQVLGGEVGRVAQFLHRLAHFHFCVFADQRTVLQRA